MILYCIILYYIVFSCSILYDIVLQCIILHYTLLYYIIHRQAAYFAFNFGMLCQFPVYMGFLRPCPAPGTLFVPFLQSWGYKLTMVVGMLRFYENVGLNVSANVPTYACCIHGLYMKVWWHKAGHTGAGPSFRSSDRSTVFLIFYFRIS